MSVTNPIQTGESSSTHAPREHRSRTTGRAAHSVAFVLPDVPGGVFSLTANILSHRTRDDARYVAVRTHAQRLGVARPTERLDADCELFFDHDLPCENLYSVMRRLRYCVPAGPGVIIANDWIELASTASYNFRKAVLFVAHGDSSYYYNLAATFHETIDIFIGVSAHICGRLRALLPDRADDVRYIPSGVTTHVRKRASVEGPLRVLFAGRFDELKGVLDLPVIAAEAAASGTNAVWTLFGDGAELDAVRASWPSHVEASWRGMQPPSMVRDACAEHDVCILPSRVEGLPIGILEAGASGLVPIVSNLPSGIPEIVHHGVTGFVCPVGDTACFAAAVATLGSDSVLLEQMSASIEAHVASAFDIARCAESYRDATIAALAQRAKRAWRGTGPFTGSRLDQRWLPNHLVRAIRTRRGVCT